MVFLKKLILEQFKGVRSAEYTFDGMKITVSGMNGTGKTTIADAWYWMLTDKQYDLQANPDVRPDYMAESEPSVTAIVEIGGVPIKLRKYQTDVRTRKQKEEGAPVRISNKYEVNDVPKSQKDFMKYLTEAGVPVELILLLSHPEYVMMQKGDDVRKLLFGMATDFTDLDVAKMIPRCAGVQKQLEMGRKLDEVQGNAKSSLSKAKKMEISIPEQIVGMEKSKVTIDPSLPEKKAQLEEELETLKAEYEKLRRESDVSVIDGRIRHLQADKVALYNKANEDRIEQLGSAQKALQTANSTINYAEASIARYDQSIEKLEHEYAEYGARAQESREKATALRKSKYTGRTVCPACGQKLPKEQVATAKQKWDADLQIKIGELEDTAQKCKDLREKITAQIKSIKASKKEAVAGRKEAEGDKKRVLTEIDKLSTPVKPDTNAIDAEIEKFEQQKVDAAKKRNELYAANQRITDKQAEIDRVVREQAKELNNSFIDDNIAKMKEEQRKYIQVKAECENILYQIQLINFKKNELLTDSVNSHFRDVKFRLFRVQKNGETVDDCTPMVKCSDGEFREAKFSANTAAITAGKLDICRGLQEYYKVRLPIFLDGAECFDSANRDAITSDTQLIMLCVSEDKELVFR